MGKLDGKIAVITGAGSGIGRSTAVLFAGEGAKVVVADYVPEGGQQTVEMIKNAGGTATFVEVDVSRAADIERLVKTAIDTYGRIDVLYNNAGIQGPVMPMTDIPPEEWDKTIATNLSSVFLGTKYAVPHMIKQGGGVIVNTASTMGLAGKATIAPYACAKAGIISLTKTAAAEYGPENIRVNCICPGVINTPMGGASADVMDMTNLPLRKIGTPEDVAKAALYLASDDSQYVSGISLVVDGGWVAETVFLYKDMPAEG